MTKEDFIKKWISWLPTDAYSIAAKEMSIELDLINKPNPINCVDVLKHHLEVNAGRLAESLLKEGKNPRDDPKCHQAFLMLAHLSEIEKYLTNNYSKTQ